MTASNPAAADQAHLTRRERLRARLFAGILPLDSTQMPKDMIAGATLAALAIPEVMGYAKIAGTPVITGLYTLLLPILLFAILGSSRHLVVGADSATAAIMAIGLVGMGAIAGSDQYTQLASFAALLCGALLIIARLFRLGFIANFLSRSVLIGFLTGVGIQVAMGQLGAMLGITGAVGGTLEKFFDTIRLIPTQLDVPTTTVTILVLGTVVVLERVNKAIPGALIAVVGSIVASAVLNLQAHSVSILGPVPGGLPALSLPTAVISAQNVAVLLPTIISMVVVILAQSAATSRAYAMRYGDSFDENIDLVGLGFANLGAGITGTFVVNGSPTKTAMVDGAGGRSQISQLTAGAIVVVVLLFLTGPLQYLPNAVLASVVFLIGLKLVDVRGMRDIARVRRGEFVVALLTAVTVVVVGVEQGILLAMAFSIIEHIAHSYRPYDSLLIQAEDGTFRQQPLDSAAQAAPGLVIYRFGASLYYANAARFSEEILELLEDARPALRCLVVSCESMGDIDYSGGDTLRQVHGELARTGVILALCGLNPRAKRFFDAYELGAVIGPERILPSVQATVDAYRSGALTPETPASPT